MAPVTVMSTAAGEKSNFCIWHEFQYIKVNFATCDSGQVADWERSARLTGVGGRYKY